MFVALGSHQLSKINKYIYQLLCGIKNEEKYKGFDVMYVIYCKVSHVSVQLIHTELHIGCSQ